MPPQLVSVIVPFLNARSPIEQQVRALLTQDYAGPWELVFADNGSTDGTADYLRGLPKPADGTTIRVVDAGGVAGAAHARNVGALHSRGDLLVFLDADDVADRSWLSGIVAAAENFDAVAGELEGERLNSPEVLAWRPVSSIRESFERARFLPCAPGGNVAVRREAFYAIGGFDESYPIAGEEPDFAWRLQLAGFTLGYATDAVVSYRLRDSRRALLRRMHAFGIAEARTYAEFREYGLPGWTPVEVAMAALYVAARNPLLPQAITKLDRTRWACGVAFFAGRLRGTLRRWPVPPAPPRESVRGRLLARSGRISVDSRGTTESSAPRRRGVAAGGRRLTCRFG